MKFAKIGCVVVLTLFGLPRIASAIIIPYGNFPAATVMYLNVTEDTNRPTPGPRFGQPDVVGDTLDFDPPDFKADTAISNPDLADGKLEFTIMSNNNSVQINNVIIDEFGGYSVLGLPTTEASAGLVVRAKCTHVLGNPINPVSVSQNLQVTFSTPPNVTGGAWSLNANLDIAAALAAAGITGHCTKVEVVLDNALSAFTTSGGRAFIDKKDFSGLTVTIPEPSVPGILTILGAMILMVRRVLC